jgi:hypothetical protein
MERKDLKDLKYCKGEYFKNKHMMIKNDDVHISDEFAAFIIPTVPILGYNNTNLKVKIKQAFLNQILTISLFKSNGLKSNYPWVVCGHCGSYGFNGLQYSSREELGVIAKRRVIRKMVEAYLSSKLSRKEKLIDILDI